MIKQMNFFSETWETIVKIVAFILLYLTPISNYIHLVLFLIFFDLVTGSYASIKAGDKFSAKKMRNTVEKFIFYALAIIAAYILQRIIDDGTETARIVALYIGSIEVKSIYENISRITKTNLVSMLYNTLKEKTEGWISALKNKPNEQN